MEKDSLIYVAGHHGLVGSAICRNLRQQGFARLLLRSRADYDLTDALAVRSFFEQERPAVTSFSRSQSRRHFSQRSVSGGLYPREPDHSDQRDRCQLPARASTGCFFWDRPASTQSFAPTDQGRDLLTGPLEPTNRPYALAKIAGIEMCWSYNVSTEPAIWLRCRPTSTARATISIPRSSHVLPALIRKVAEAKALGRKQIVVWGTGTPRRELLFSEDLAEACVFLMNLEGDTYSSLLEGVPLINVGTGSDVTIRELAEQVCAALGFAGELVFDTTSPMERPRSCST